MKKKNKFADCSVNELSSKQKELMKVFASFKVSMDPASLENIPGGLQGLRRDLKLVQRQIALSSAIKQDNAGRS